MKLKKVITLLMLTIMTTSSITSFAQVQEAESVSEVQASWISEFNIYAKQYENVDVASLDEEQKAAIREELEQKFPQIKHSKYKRYVGIHLYQKPRLIIMDKAGWAAVKQVLTIGGGAATVGGAIGTICGVTLAAPIAAALGGVIVMAGASIELQFALGYSFATISF
jgi:hypothetical protein